MAYVEACTEEYGERLDVTSSGEKLPVPAHEIDARIQSIIMQAAARRVAAINVPQEAQGLLE